MHSSLPSNSGVTFCCIFLARLHVIGPAGVGVEVGKVVGVVDDAGVCISDVDSLHVDRRSNR
jgi:hypothetical protein